MPIAQVNLLLHNIYYTVHKCMFQLAENQNADEKSRTFVFENEGHTLGNALRCIICR